MRVADRNHLDFRRGLKGRLENSFLSFFVDGRCFSYAQLYSFKLELFTLR